MRGSTNRPGSSSVACEVPRGKGVILIAAAGTSDIPVAEEAAISAEVMGNDVDRLYDVGVAGLHRLLAERASARRGARRDCRRRHGGRAARASSAAWCRCRSSRCRPASGTARASADSRRSSRCSTRAPRASRSSTSTTALARRRSRARSIICRDRHARGASLSTASLSRGAQRGVPARARARHARAHADHVRRRVRLGRHGREARAVARRLLERWRFCSTTCRRPRSSSTSTA